MNRAQRTVALVVSCLVAATLFFGIPKQGRYEVTLSKEQVEWDLKAAALEDSFEALLSSNPLERLAGLTRNGTHLFPDTMLKRLERQGIDDTRAGYLGPRPTRPVTRFIHNPDAREVLLRYVLPLLVVGLGFFVVLGKSKGGSPA